MYELGLYMRISVVALALTGFVSFLSQKDYTFISWVLSLFFVALHILSSEFDQMGVKD